MARLVAALLLIAAALGGAAAAGERAHRGPVKGFNTWSAFGPNSAFMCRRKAGRLATPRFQHGSCDGFFPPSPTVNESLVLETADAMVSLGLVELGYEYLIVDDGWASPAREPNGTLLPNSALFPRGMAFVASELRRRGLRFGLYSSASERTCQGLPGSLGFEAEDAASFAAWGVDYVKMDNCGAPSEPPPQERFARMGAALRAATTRPLVYAVCDWGVGEPWLWARGTADSWRVGGDSSARWGALTASIDAMTGLGAYAGPGGWNDADMLEVGNSGLNDQEQEVQMALWCLFKTPLLISTDLRGAAGRNRHAPKSCSPSSSSKAHRENEDCADKPPPGISPRALSLLKNKNLLAIHSDPLHVAGDLIWRQAHKHVFAAPLVGDARVLVFLSCAVTDNVQPLTRISMPWSRLGYPHGSRLGVHDALENRSLGVVSEGIVVEVLPHSVKVIVVRPEGRSDALVGEGREDTTAGRQPSAREMGRRTDTWTPWADEPMFAPHHEYARGYVESLHVA